MNDTPKQTQETCTSEIMRKIREGKITMRPRWLFVVKAVAGVLLGIVVLLTLLVVASLIVFSIRETGLLVVSDFGPEGWLELLIALPWVIVVASSILLLLLSLCVRRYAFVYRQPLLYVLLSLLVISGIGVILLDRIHAHQQMRMYSRTHQFSPVERFYRQFVTDHSDHVFRGALMESGVGMIVIVDADGTQIPVRFDDATRFPGGMQFATGAPMVVFGEQQEGWVHAHGVRVFTP